MNFKDLKDKLDIAPLIGFTLGGLCVITVLLGEGRKLGAFISMDAFAVVVGGSLGAALIVLNSRDFKTILHAIPSLFGWFEDPRPRLASRLKLMLATHRRHGRLRLQDHLKEIKDPVLKTAITQFVDGTGIDIILQVLETEKDRVRRRGEVTSVFFENLGGFAPTFGIVGTVISLVSVLSHLDEPTLLAQGVAEAFIATFYGVLFANLVFLPLSMRNSNLTQYNVETIDMLAVGLKALSKEEHPLLLSERLGVFLVGGQKS